MPLYHCTKSVAAVANILKHGFAYVALPTNVASLVLPNLPSLEREPQQFGMVCFRYQADGIIPEQHRANYGRYAICVDTGWAIASGANPVLYIRPDGSVAAAYARLFRAAKKAVDRELARYPDDAARVMMIGNGNMAGMLGAPEWSDLLAIFQFMAPTEDQWENEWRIVNRIPNYSISKTSAGAIPQVCPPQGWATVMNVIKLPRDAVLYLCAPVDEHAVLRQAIPEDFGKIEIREEVGP